jgi:CubicO group peptidase (beta-lactamase class C family)
MRRPRSFLAVCALLLSLAGAAAPAAGAPPTWPDTPASRHAQAWLRAFGSGDEQAMRKMLRGHFAARALAATPVEERLARLRRTRSQAGGGFTPVRVVEADAGFVRLVAKDGTGGWAQLDFLCEERPPFGLTGVRLGEIGDPDAVGPRPPALPAADLPARFDAYLAERTQAGEFAGVVLVARNGTPVFRRACGIAERRFGAPVREDTRFNLGSLNKLFTKLAVAQLAEAGRLRLDDTLSRWVPDWPGESGRRITLAMLAEHRAGTTDIFNERFERMDRSTLRHNRDYVALFRDDSLWFEPGTSQRYSNGGYVLLGEVVGKASGEDYYDYVRRHVFEPAGMKGTDSYAADDPTPDVAMGYYREGDGPLRENVFTRPARGSAAGGGYSTADDLLRFEQALRGAKLAGPAWSRWVLGGPPPGAAPAAAPLPDAYSMAGGAPGISASLTHSGEWTLVVLSNLDRDIMGKVERRLQEWLEVVKD